MPTIAANRALNRLRAPGFGLPPSLELRRTAVALAEAGRARRDRMAEAWSLKPEAIVITSFHFAQRNQTDRRNGRRIDVPFYRWQVLIHEIPFPALGGV